MDTDDDLVWLGEDMIQQNGTHITMPSEVVTAGIVEPGQPVFWAVDDEGVLISQQRSVFEQMEQVQMLGETAMMANMEVKLPSEVTKRNGFDSGDILHFVADGAVDVEQVCRVMTEDMSEQLES